MEAKRKSFIVMLGLLAITLFTAPLRAQSEKTNSQPSGQNLFFPVWALERHELTRIAVASLFVGDTTIGVVVVYDDPTTTRPADLLELYDDTGHLLAVSWFDRSGIERVAADRGFLDGRNELEGVFVILLDGDTV